MTDLIVLLIWLIGVIISCIIIGLLGDYHKLVGVVDQLVVYGCFAMFALLWPFILMLCAVALIPGMLIISVVYLKRHK